MSNVSNDLLWALTKDSSSFIVKRRTAGGVEFSRDPLNPTGKNTFQASGLVHDKAIGAVGLPNGKVVILAKTAKGANKPSKSVAHTVLAANKSSRAAKYAASTAAHKYRDDLLEALVLKVSALKRIQKPKKSYPVSSRKH